MVSRDSGSGTHSTFLTNDFEPGAGVIVCICNKRRYIELFFKEIKQICASGALSAHREKRSQPDIHARAIDIRRVPRLLRGNPLQ